MFISYTIKVGIITLYFTSCIYHILTLTLTLNKIYFDINEKDKQQEIDNMIL